MTKGTCSVDGCTKPVWRRDLCSVHYSRWIKVNGPGRPRSRGLVDRLDEKIVTGPGCWAWIGSRATGGYGSIWRDGRNVHAHRAVYELLVGPIPDGLHIDHLCRNRNCVNPDHLEPVTLVENILRGEGIMALNARKTHCMHGHPFTEENTHWRARDGKLWRSCRTCEQASWDRQKAKKKAS